MKLSRLVAALVAGMMGSGLALAKLPPLTEEQQKAAAEKKEKAAEGAKKDAEALDKARDRVAQRYIADMKAKGIEVKPTPIPPPAPPAAAPAPAAPAAAAAPAAPAAAKKP